MPLHDDPDQPRTKMDALLNFIYSPDEDIDAMSEGEVVAFLHSEGLEPDGRIGQLYGRLTAIDGAERLEKAKQQRDAAAKVASPSIGETISDIRSELLRRLAVLRQRNPQSAGMYARNFEKLSEADMLDMLDDLAELENVRAEDDKEQSG